MTDTASVLADLLDHDRRPGAPWPGKSSRVLQDQDVAHLDYGDADHTYRVTVTVVPRRHLEVPQNNIAEIGGIGIRLASVEISTDTKVVINAYDGPQYQSTMAAFRSDYQRWERTPDRPMPPPPAWPADKLFGCIRISDDTGTAYRMHAGRAGGTGTEFECTHAFDPAPPASAHRLQIDVVHDDVVIGSVSLDLCATCLLASAQSEI